MTTISMVGGGRLCVADLVVQLRLHDGPVLVHASVWTDEPGTLSTKLGDGVVLEHVRRRNRGRTLIERDLTPDEDDLVLTAVRASASDALKNWRAA